eukprot:282173_1
MSINFFLFRFVLFNVCILFYASKCTDMDANDIETTIKPYKKWRKYIDCDVCKVSMTWLYKLNNEMRSVKNFDYGEYELENLLERLCESETATGGWIRTFEIIHNKTSNTIHLSFVNKTLECDRFHKTIESSCQYIMDINNDEIIHFIFNKYNNGIYDGFVNELVQNICQKTCDLWTKWKNKGKLEKGIKKFYKDIGMEYKDKMEEMSEEEKKKEKELEETRKNIKKVAEEFGWQYGDSKEKKMFNFGKKKPKPLTEAQRTAQEGMSKEELEQLKYEL